MDQGTRKMCSASFLDDIHNYFGGDRHRMKPTRIRMCHSLVMNYGLYEKMEIFVGHCYSHACHSNSR